MEFVLTQVGLDAVNAAGSGGPLVNVTTFKVGSASGYTPDLSDTDLHGTIYHTGSISGYSVISSDLVEWLLTMDETVGDFDFGEIGLYLDSGELFALYAMPGTQNKASTSSGNANVITIQARSPGVTSIASTIQFTVNSVSITKALEIAGVHLLNPPVSALSGSNFYLCDLDDGGNRIKAYHKSDYEWSLDNFTRIISGTVTAGTNTATQITSTDIGTDLSDFAADRYLIQFLTGVHQGLVRKISAQASNEVQWTDSLDSAPSVGDTFAIYQSNFSLNTSSQEIGTVTSVDNLLKPTDVSAIYDMYLAGRDETGKRILVFKSAGGTDLWSFNDFTKVLDATVDGASSTTEVISSDLGKKFATLSAVGSILLQFTSGSNKGLVRRITNVGTEDSLEWVTALPSAPLASDTFSVYLSDASNNTTHTLASVDVLPRFTTSPDYIREYFADSYNSKRTVAYKGSSEWNFYDYELYTSGTTSGAGTTTTIEVSTAVVTSLLTDFASGKYILQFNDVGSANEFEGTVRRITAASGTTISFSTAYSGATTGSLGFKIYKAGGISQGVSEIEIHPVVREIRKSALCFPKSISTAVSSAMGVDPATMANTAKWAGGVVGTDGKIYGVPLSNDAVLVIDPVSETATEEDFGLTLTNSLKYWGGVLAQDGKIYCVPHNENNVLIIDPVTNSATTNSFGGAVTASANKFKGGVLGTDGKIYCVPYFSAGALVIDVEAGTASVEGFGLGLSAATANYSGGVLGPDGKIYCAPWDRTDILIIDPETSSATLNNFGLSISGAITQGWSGGALGPDGKIYFMPHDGEHVIIIDPATQTATLEDYGLTLTASDKFHGAVVGADGKIYGIPYSGSTFLVIDAIRGTAELKDFSLSLAGTFKCVGGACAPNGKVYAVPYNDTGIYQIQSAFATPLDDAVLMSPYLNKF